jgi:hypothetical protein
VTAFQRPLGASRQCLGAKDGQALAHWVSVHDGVALKWRSEEGSRTSQRLESSSQPATASVQPSASTNITQETPSGRTAER